MPGRPPDRIAHLLLAPDAWLSADTVYDRGQQPTARNFLTSLWTVLADTLPSDFPTEAVRVAVLRSLGVSVRVHAEHDETFTITISQGVLLMYDAYTRAWAAHYHPEVVDPDTSPVRDGRHAVLDMAVDFRNTGVVRPRSVPLTADGIALAGQHMAVGLVFLLTHEAAHVTSGHLAAAGAGPDVCLDVDPHTRELQADHVAAEFMAARPPHLTAPGQSLRILFEMLQILAVGTPGATSTHPHPIERLLAVLGTVDPGARDVVTDDLMKRRRSWLVDSD